MNRKVKLVLLGVGTTGVAAVGTAVAASVSYVTSAGDRTRWGVRVFEHFGVEEKLRARLVRESDREQGIPGPLRRYVDSLQGEEREAFIVQHNAERKEADLPPRTF